jgi:hypothetical protein
VYWDGKLDMRSRKQRRSDFISETLNGLLGIILIPLILGLIILIF